MKLLSKAGRSFLDGIVYPRLTRVDLDEASELAKSYDHSYDMIVLTAFVQRYMGGLERVLLSLMGLVAIAGIWSALTLSFTGAIHSLGIGFVLYLEYLYCRKGSSFLTAVQGLARALCPDKDPSGKYSSIQETVSDVTDKVVK